MSIFKDNLFSFQKESRSTGEKGGKSNRTPGPGSYSISSVIGNEGAKSSFHLRSSSISSKNINPGPGSYNPLNKLVFQKNDNVMYFYQIFKII